jgi:hypothetical protein
MRHERINPHNNPVQNNVCLGCMSQVNHKAYMYLLVRKHNDNLNQIVLKNKTEDNTK